MSSQALPPPEGVTELWGFSQAEGGIRSVRWELQGRLGMS